MNARAKIALFSLTGGGLAVADEIARRWPHATRHHRPAPFTGVARRAFADGHHCVFVCAAGIVLRTLGPVLRDKFQDPAVIVIDEGGRYVVPLLSSHEGGGGALARDIADHLGAHCVSTSMTDYGRPVHAIGIGSDRGCPVDKLVQLLARARQQLDDDLNCMAVASIDLKADEPAMRRFADGLGLELRTFTAGELRRVEDQLTERSDIVFREVGCYGVAEAAALLAVDAVGGAAAELVVPKLKNDRATLAIARGYLQPDETPAVQPPAKSLFLVSTGPGDPALLPGRARDAIAASSDVVGYGLYLDLLGGLLEGKSRHALALGEEAVRAQRALELAASGRPTALLSSGDVGIYAMASLVFELMDGRGAHFDPAWLEVDIECIPGITAMQANAALAGAPLGHDFCAVSLSDLLTPWPVIEQRLHAAGAGDFVVSLYNPVSRKRNWQLERARDILLEYRPGHTPVIVGRNLGRRDQQQAFTTLEQLRTDDADMFTCITVGNRETRRISADRRDWIYTPRGYARDSSATDDASPPAREAGAR